MDQTEFITILQSALILILELAGPVLLVSMIVGLVIGVFQSVTQIQESTISFVPKILAGIFTIILLAPWMVKLYVTSVNDLFANLLMYIR